MNKLFLKLTVDPKVHKFEPNEMSLNYIHKFYTEQLFNDYNDAISKGYIDSDKFTANSPNTNSAELFVKEEKSSIWIEESTNTLCRTFTGKNLQKFWDILIIEKQYLKPIIDHLTANPNEGNLEITWYTLGIPREIDPNSLYS
jgi:hypothetical protein